MRLPSCIGLLLPVAVVPVASLSAPAAVAAPAGSAFSYQGSLSESGAPANGIYDFEVCLYGVAAGGAPLACSPVFDDQPVANGLFTLSLDFGTANFRGDARWLELRVRPGAGGAFTPLAPRTPVQPVPYALRALSVDASAVSSAYSIRTIGPQYFLASQGNALAVGPSGTPALAVLDLPSGAPRLSFWICADAECTSGAAAPYYEGVPGELASAAVATGPDGVPVAAFVVDGALRTARCNDAACASPVVSGLLFSGVVHQSVDIASTAASAPVISLKNTSGDVRVLVCQDPACKVLSDRLVFDTGEASLNFAQTSVALASGDLPRIAYISGANGSDFQLALCGGPSCGGGIPRQSLAALQSTFDRGPSLALAPDGTAAVAYSRLAVPGVAFPSSHLLLCADPGCTGGVTTRQFATPNASGADPSPGVSVLAIGPDAVPIVAFGGSDTGGMYVLHGRPREFTVGGAGTTMLDPRSDPHPPAAIALRPNGLPVIAYRASDGLRVASCTTRTCQ